MLSLEVDRSRWLPALRTATRRGLRDESTSGVAACPHARRLDAVIRGISLHHEARRSGRGLPDAAGVRRARATARATTAPRSRRPSTRRRDRVRRHRVRAGRPLSADAHHLRLAGRARDRLRHDAAGLRARRQHARIPEGHRPHGDVHVRRPPRRCATRGGGRVPFPPPGSVPPNDNDPGRRSEHLLFGHEQHRLRDRRRQSGGDRASVSMWRSMAISATWTSTSDRASPR